MTQRATWRLPHSSGRRMWSRASKVSDAELVAFTIKNDLVEVRAGATSYGTIVFGKIRIPALTTEEAGDGFVHVR